jgi:Fe-S-cluster-containing hydrogenase component 2
LPYIYCDSKLCTGCRTCELVCVGFHDRLSNPKASRIRVIRSEPASDVAITCRQCENAPCMMACPVSAIRKLKSGLVEVVDARCIGCGACAEACPFGAIWLHPVTKTALKCDLCGGDPQCVKQCMPVALSLTTPEQVAEKTRLDEARRMSKIKQKV